MSAREYSNQRIRLPDGSLVSIVIWELPTTTKERPHGFKYRLQYCAPDGATLVRYDNEQGKGDHKHIGEKEEPYEFQDIDTLLDDFWRDVDEIMERKQDE